MAQSSWVGLHGYPYRPHAVGVLSPSCQQMLRIGGAAMRRADRLFEIIEILRHARGPLFAAMIGDELGVTKRTFYRDVVVLVAQRVPIRGEAGVGYVLEAGFHMPPLMLTADEVEAAVLGAE